MGTPMMDFVVRETRAVVDGPMAIIRLGTCGLLDALTPVGTLVVASQGSVLPPLLTPPPPPLSAPPDLDDDDDGSRLSAANDTSDSHAAVLASRSRVQSYLQDQQTEMDLRVTEVRERKAAVVQETMIPERRASVVAQAKREEEARRLEVEALVSGITSQPSAFNRGRSGSITGTASNLRRQFLEAAEAGSTVNCTALAAGRVRR